MPTANDSDWLTRLKYTMSLDLPRGMQQGLPPAALIELLFRIPECQDAFELRALARRDRNGKWYLPED